MLVLIDRDSALNYINVCRQTDQPSATNATPFSVGIADGNKLTGSGTFNVSLAIQGSLFTITVSFLALKGSEVVLGCNWPWRLENISINFDKLIMSLFSQWQKMPVSRQ